MYLLLIFKLNSILYRIIISVYFVLDLSEKLHNYFFLINKKFDITNIRGIRIRLQKKSQGHKNEKNCQLTEIWLK